MKMKLSKTVYELETFARKHTGWLPPGLPGESDAQYRQRLVSKENLAYPEAREWHCCLGEHHECKNGEEGCECPCHLFADTNESSPEFRSGYNEAVRTMDELLTEVASKLSKAGNQEGAEILRESRNELPKEI